MLCRIDFCMSVQDIRLEGFTRVTRERFFNYYFFVLHFLNFKLITGLLRFYTPY